MSASTKRRLPAPGSVLGLALLSLATAYVWLLPLVRPRGYYLWGLQLRDLYLGIPVLLALLCAVVIAVTPRASRRAFALRAVSVTFGVGVALFASDAFFSLVYCRSWQASPWFDHRAFNRQHHLLDPELGYARKPNSTWRGRLPDGRPYVWRTDEHGFRNPGGLQRAELVFVGDSYTEAMQVPVEDTFVHRVSSALGRTAANLGVSGYAPQQELIVLKRYGLGYRPRLVIWQLFEGNDLTDAEFFHRWKHGPAWPVRPFWQRYIDNSLFHAWVEPTLNKEKSFAHALASVRRSDGLLRPTLLGSGYEPDGPALHPVGWQETCRAITEGYHRCRERGIELRVLFAPIAIRTMRDDVVFNRVARREDYLPTAAVTHRTDFGSRLGEFCRSLGVPYLDTLPALDAAYQTRRDLFVPDDEHFTAAGHEVVTREILNWIEAEPAR